MLGSAVVYSGSKLQHWGRSVLYCQLLRSVVESDSTLSSRRQLRVTQRH